MSDLLDLILSTSPGNGDVSVPLKSNINIVLSGTDYDTDSLKEGFFIEGPDTDQLVGPGLLELAYPQNISQGALDDFLKSPGYQGIVEGEVTVTGILGNTHVIFDPTLPLAPSTLYKANLTQILDAMEAEIEGFVTFSFTTGTGSIEEIPSSVSTSVLSTAIAESQSMIDSDLTPLAVVATIPKINTVEHDPEKTDQIVIEFNRVIDPSSVIGQVSVKTFPISDHPNITSNSQGDLATVVEVDGKKITIKL
jgi:hypothetical protein